MMTSSEIRKTFLDFFKSKEHAIVPSAPIVIKNDPTLLFTNAGMNQFKDWFLGNATPAHKRVADTQKCLRVSGKHNDLEEVGVDTYHHTMFEMLGNWSFGDYFKKEAIQWSWELLTEVYKLDKDRLYVSVFEGDAKEGLPKDEEAYNEWKKYIAEDRILNGNKKDNFWEMGDTGPCGPCSEIHVDCRSDEERKTVDGKTLVNADHPQVIEIWNNVFMQFNRLKDGTLQPLPAQHVDTGMGFERLVRVIQKKNSNYDTDLFTNTIEVVEKLTGKKYDFSDTKEAIAFRVLADHIRAIAFTIADGQLPSNTGAGYVIRRILRRAVRYYFSYLEYKQPLLHQLMPVLAKQFAEVFPELEQQVDFVSKVVREEELSFLKTIETGLNSLDEIKGYYLQQIEDISQSFKSIEKTSELNYKQEISLAIENSLKRPHTKEMFPEKLDYYLNLITNFSSLEDVKEVLFKHLKTINGKSAFILYDTYGFPLDLTKLVAGEEGFNVDEEGFNIEMQKQKDRSRAATVVDTEDWIILNENATSFAGYDKDETTTTVARYRKVKAKGKESYQIVLNETPFYAESGGQVGDTGELTIRNTKYQILNTKKENNLIIHFADEIPSDLSGEVIATIDVQKRRDTEVHHSATHLLHAALREVLGTHVAQKGSLVNNDYLRFDFSHFSKVTDEEIQKIEAIVNQKIRENIPVVIQEMDKDDAIALGAMALFGEKYGDKVRVVIMDKNYSIELCGGTHVGSTGQLGFLKITHESAVAAGVRRIEAVSGKAAESYINTQLQTLSEIKTALKNPKELTKAIEKVIAGKMELEKTLESLVIQQTQEILTNLSQQKIVSHNGFEILYGSYNIFSIDVVDRITNAVRTSSKNSLLIIGGKVKNQNSGKITYLLNSTDDKYKWNLGTNIIEKIIETQLAGGGFGGNQTYFNAMGTFKSSIDEIILRVKESSLKNLEALKDIDDFLTN